MTKGDFRNFFLIGSLLNASSLNGQPLLKTSGTDAHSIISSQLFVQASESSTAKDSVVPSPRNAPLREIGPGIFQLGDITIDKHQRTVSFPAVLNLRQGAMEYLLVSSWGKVHESILRTETEPYRIHLAMLLLGAKGAGTNDEETIEVPGPFLSHPANVRVPGDHISIEIRWKTSAKEIRRRAEELVYNVQKKSRLGRGNWIYNGSFMEETTFLAQREGSIISLVTDPEALINSNGVGHDNDTIWIANTNRLPSANVPLQVLIKLSKPSQKRQR